MCCVAWCARERWEFIVYVGATAAVDKAAMHRKGF